MRDLGATYHSEDIDQVIAEVRPDVVLEATGAGRLVFAAMAGTAPYGIVCLTGVSPRGRQLSIDAGSINRELVLENDAVVGSVNANLRHYQQAADALAKADPGWLERIVTDGCRWNAPPRRSPLRTRTSRSSSPSPRTSDSHACGLARLRPMCRRRARCEDGRLGRSGGGFVLAPVSFRILRLSRSDRRRPRFA
ncbi:hypothetical protein [Streptomyces tendae]|uniref:hypothetical protein n=1 Tax=Streptomyces tendae TaxID=1932 RepID=UPI003211EB71